MLNLKGLIQAEIIKNPVFIILNMHVQNKKIRNFVSISPDDPYPIPTRTQHFANPYPIPTRTSVQHRQKIGGDICLTTLEKRRHLTSKCVIDAQCSAQTRNRWEHLSHYYGKKGDI